jgi:glycosyltransferase involved in cell wall biosynthesis
VASRLARRHSIPYLIEPYGMLDAVLFKLRSHFLKKMYMRFVLQDSMRRAAWVHPASDHEVVDIRLWAPAARIKVIPHGADIPDFNAAEAARGFLAKFPQLEGKRVILFLSRVASKKRPQWLVEAVARLRTEHPDLVLLLVGGDGGHMKVVDDVARRLGVEDRVIDGGFLEGDMKHGAFAVAEVFALPSIDENFGIVVAEAMAHGVPALVTPGVASHVYVDACGGGITVEDNIESVVDGLRQLLAADGKAIGEKGRRYIEQNLSWESIARQIDSLYQEALAEKAR